MSKELREKIIAFLGIQKDKIGVISTVSPENKPESAFVYYTFDLELNIYFACKDSSRKYKNILENKDVAFTIAAGDPPQTLQLEGRASVESSIGAQKRLFVFYVLRRDAGTCLNGGSMRVCAEVVHTRIVRGWRQNTLGDNEGITEKV